MQEKDNSHKNIPALGGNPLPVTERKASAGSKEAIMKRETRLELAK